MKKHEQLSDVYIDTNKNKYFVTNLKTPSGLEGFGVVIAHDGIVERYYGCMMRGDLDMAIISFEKFAESKQWTREKDIVKRRKIKQVTLEPTTKSTKNKRSKTSNSAAAASTASKTPASPKVRKASVPKKVSSSAASPKVRKASVDKTVKTNTVPKKKRGRPRKEASDAK